jgi:phospholipid/cholesterol/gamma-HCH transport system substrate-binding protein
VSGCGLRMEQLPAPNPLSGATYHLTVQFRDIELLTVGAKVKLQGAIIGAVSSLRTKNFVAYVGVDIEKKFPLSADATFQVRFSTPLGDDFVSVTSTLARGAPRLRDGQTVPLRQTSDAPSIEDTFAAVSTLLNGGGLDQLHTIATELQTALHGRTQDVRQLLDKLDTVVASLDTHKDDITNALDGLQRMASSLNAGQDVIKQALAEFPATLKALTDDTAKVKLLLSKVATLGDTVRGFVARSGEDMQTLLDELRPTLDSLRAADDTLVPTFNELIRFGTLFDRATPGDYINVSGTLTGLLEATAYRPTPGGSEHSTAPAATGNNADSVRALLTGGRP